MRSARVLESTTKQEEDLHHRSTKKVKTRNLTHVGDSQRMEYLSSEQVVEGLAEVATSPKPSASYKEMLLRPLGQSSDDDMSEQEVDDEDLPENRWYKEAEEEFSQSPIEYLGFYPIILVDKKEYEQWCSPW